MYTFRRSSQGSLSSVTTTSSSSSSSSSTAGVSTSASTTSPSSSLFSFSPSASPWFPSATGPSSSTTSSTLVPGSFYQLMSKYESPDVYRQYSDVMDELKIVDHPVAVFEVRGDFAYVLVTSSLKGTALPDYQKGKPSMIRVQMEHVPIYPQVAHHLTGERYYLADGGHFHKAIYIKIMDLHRVPVASLRPFTNGNRGRQLRFAPECWSDLLRARTMTNTDRLLVASASSSPSSSRRSNRSDSPLASLPPRTLTSGSSDRVNQPWRSTSDPGPSTPPLRVEDAEPLQRTRSRKVAAMAGIWRRSC